MTLQTEKRQKIQFGPFPKIFTSKQNFLGQGNQAKPIVLLIFISRFHFSLFQFCDIFCGFSNSALCSLTRVGMHLLLA